MDKYKLIFPASILLGCIILGGFYYSSQTNKLQSAQKQNMLDAKKRLIELTISREKFFWDCFSNKSIELENEWRKTEEFLNVEKKYKDCESNKKGSSLDKLFACLKFEPKRPWQTWNEEASKYCSEAADNTQEGVLIKKFRAIVPIEIITDNELRELANANRGR